jgi:tetratricopeptide (TPR) repeat protein
VDVSGLGAAELAALVASSLSLEQLEQAHQAALRLDALELAGKFAKELIARPPDAARPDRAPWYFSLSQRAVTEGHADEALSLISEGERYDREHNEGRRGDEFALRRGQIHVKRGEAQQAQEVFEQMLARDPSNQRARGSAAEGMLSLREGARALRFAEAGLATARQRNDRDSEQYFLELVAAAKKQVSG